jgi:hypothetical protein
MADLPFDGAGNYFVKGTLSTAEKQITGILGGADRIRPRPGIDPNHALLKVVFDDEVFVLSLDAKTASLTNETGVLDPMTCCRFAGSVCF